MLFPNPAKTVRWINLPGARGRPQCDQCGHVPRPEEIADAAPEFIGQRPLDAGADFVADAFSYGQCPRCGKGDLTLLLVPQRLFGDVVPSDL
jgi:hypothetical protein